jgi:hypothetical protein
MADFAAHPRVGRAGQHAVFCCHPAQPGALDEGRHPILDRGGAQNMGIAHLDQRGSFRMFGKADLNRDSAHFIEFPA